jgi:hypothetical protein
MESRHKVKKQDTRVHQYAGWDLHSRYRDNEN